MAENDPFEDDWSKHNSSPHSPRWLTVTGSGATKLDEFRRCPAPNIRMEKYTQSRAILLSPISCRLCSLYAARQQRKQDALYRSAEITGVQKMSTCLPANIGVTRHDFDSTLVSIGVSREGELVFLAFCLVCLVCLVTFEIPGQEHFQDIKAKDVAKSRPSRGRLATQ